MGKESRRKQPRPEGRPAKTAPPPAAPSAPARTRAAAAPRRAPADTLALAAPIILALTVFAVYANSFSIPLLFDDYIDIVKSPSVKAIESPLAYLSRARGVVAFTFAFNHALAGQEVWGYHFVNVCVHAANAILLYLLVLATLRLPFWRGKYAAHAVPLALVVALLFAVHPLQTMAVSYIAQRAESIASMFYLLTLLLFVRATTAGDRTKQAVWFAATLAAAFLGVVSKQIVATVPVIALLYYVCFLAGGAAEQPSGSGTTQRRLPFSILLTVLAVPVAYSLYLSWSYLASSNTPPADGLPDTWINNPSAGFNIEGITPWRYLLTQFGVILWYLRLIALPTRLCFDYGWPLADSPWQADVLLPLLALVSIVVTAILAFRRYRFATFCILWFFVVIAPSSSFIPLRDAAFEYRVYLPIAGLLWLAVVGVHDAVPLLAARIGASADAARTAAAISAGVWVALLGVATLSRNQVYQDPLVLAADSAARAPWHWRPFFHLGSGLVDQGRTAEAIAPLQKAIELGPEHGQAYIALGTIFMEQRRFAEAERTLTYATKVKERTVVAAAWVNLANLYQAKGALNDAAEAYTKATILMPLWTQAHINAAQLYARIDRPFRAAHHFDVLAGLKPQNAAQYRQESARPFLKSSAWFYHSGNFEGAVGMSEHALERNPDLHGARHLFAVSLAGLGKWDEATAEIDRLAQALPSDATVRENQRRIAARESPLSPLAPSPAP